VRFLTLKPDVVAEEGIDLLAGAVDVACDQKVLWVIAFSNLEQRHLEPVGNLGHFHEVDLPEWQHCCDLFIERNVALDLLLRLLVALSDQFLEKLDLFWFVLKRLDLLANLLHGIYDLYRHLAAGFVFLEVRLYSSELFVYQFLLSYLILATGFLLMRVAGCLYPCLSKDSVVLCI